MSAKNLRNFEMNSRHWQVTLAVSISTLIFTFFSTIAFAYPTYDGCKNCHGDFEERSYVSKHDGAGWGGSLMDRHETFVGGNCDACHKDGSKGDVYLNFSRDNSLSTSCVGCHGRPADVNGSCNGDGGVPAECGSGAGLRQVHERNVSQGACSSCHSGDPTPVGENINPSFYGMNRIVMKDSCDADSSESQFGTTGLDNDGDGQRDADDPDCQANSVPSQPGMLSASAITSSSATVQWGASTDGNGDAITYQVDYRRNGEASWNDGGSTSNTMQSLNGLDAGQSYDVQVTPNDGNVDGPVRSALNLFQTDADEQGFMINDALSDAWFFPETDGQGFLIIVWETRKLVFLAWYTYDTERPPEDVTAILGEPGHRWLTALGPYEGDTALMDVFLSQGMVFDSAEPPVDTEQMEGASIEITWTNCNEAVLNYDIPTLGLAGEIPIQRIVLDHVATCVEAQSQ
jgi:hypothetical protein